MFIHPILVCSLLILTVPADCRNITDQDRRPFDDLRPITFDADGDDNLDIITPRTYTVKAGGAPSAKLRRRARESHWITFDLRTGRGRVLNSFFRYEYGTDEADYWVYALVPCDVNNDGRVDLVFYSGDDTSDETVILLNTGKTFKVHSRKVSVEE